jgi:hypothetical protein
MTEGKSLTHGGHVLTDEDRLKKTGKRNPGTSIINAIKHRRTCGSRCPIFEVCPMMPLSVSRANPESRCLLNLGGNVLIRRFMNLIVKGEDGLINEINNVLYSYAQDIEVASPAVKKDYAMMCMQLHRQLYGDPRRAQMEAKPQLTVVINEMDGEGRIREVEVVPVVEAGGINNAKLDIEAAKMIMAAKEDDPESLVNSPIFDKLFENVPTHGTSAEQRNTVQGKGGKFERKVNVPKQDTGTADDESARTEGEPEELAQASGSTSGGS